MGLLNILATDLNIVTPPERTDVGECLVTTRIHLTIRSLGIYKCLGSTLIVLILLDMKLIYSQCR